MDLLTQHETAGKTRLSERTLERHRLAGTGPKFVRLGRRVFYRRDDLEAWIADCTSRSTSEADAKDERRGDAGAAIGQGSVVIRPPKKIPAGIAPDDQGPDDPHPPLAVEGPPIDSERYHTLNKNSGFSSARVDAPRRRGRPRKMAHLALTGSASLAAPDDLAADGGSTRLPRYRL